MRKQAEEPQVAAEDRRTATATAKSFVRTYRVKIAADQDVVVPLGFAVAVPKDLGRFRIRVVSPFKIR